MCTGIKRGCQSYIAVYSALALIAVMVYTLAILLYYGGAIRASRTIHQRIVGSILGTTLRLVLCTPG